MIEFIAEITVIISLFTVGLKLRLPFRDRLWRVPLSLSTISMIVMIASVTVIGFFGFGFSWAEGILLGAVLAPTDPVLASEVQLSDPDDRDPLKFSLTTEGGLNDGMAFPFVMLGLGLLNAESEPWSFSHWIFVDLLWAIACGIGVGVLSGVIINYLAYYVKDIRKSYYMEDFLTIASIALSYGLAIQFKGYGFLAVFANALTIRQLELRESGLRKKPKKDLPDDVLSFNEQLERIFEVASVVVIGVLIDFRSFDLVYLGFALVLFFLVRPVATLFSFFGSSLRPKQKILISWFGIRGIGSLYYLYYARNHGLGPESFQDLGELLLWTVFFSVIVHGISVTPILKRYQ